MHWTSTTPTETMEWRHSAFPEMEKSSSFSALINYRYIADSTTRSWWRVCSAKTIERKSEWTFTFNNIQFMCRNKPTSHINHLESAFNFVIISTSCYIFRKKKPIQFFFVWYNIPQLFPHWHTVLFLLKICIDAPKLQSSFSSSVTWALKKLDMTEEKKLLF